MKIFKKHIKVFSKRIESWNLLTFQFLNFSIFQSFNLLILSFLILNSSFLISQNSLDNLTYTYKANTNQLKYITDVVGSATSSVDLDNQSFNNYIYDASGQLTKDNAEGILSITWTVSGKVKQVNIDDNGDLVTDRSLQFKYDAMGNRVKKIETDLTGVNPPLTTYYIRNAMGALISTYIDDGSGVERKEVSIAVGTDNSESDSITNGVFSRNVGFKNYELKDHLGSLRVVVNDVKEPVLGSTTFTSNITHSSDYYSYGALMPGRDFSSSNYRLAYQGMEKDDELKSNGNSYTTFYRLYDPRVGRWNSLDPKINYESPYSGFGSNPIMNIDPLGDTTMVFTLKDGGDAGVAEYTSTIGLNEKGVSIMVMNEMDGSVRGYSLNDPRDAGIRKVAVGDFEIASITRLIINGEEKADEILNGAGKLNRGGVPDGNTMSEAEKWSFTYNESMAGGKIDFANTIMEDELAIVNGQAYNNYDFGNLVWGAAMRKLGWSYTMVWAGSNYNAWYNEKTQNGFPIANWTQDKYQQMFNINRLTWRKDDCYLCFDEKYDQSAIYEGYNWFKDTYEPDPAPAPIYPRYIPR